MERITLKDLEELQTIYQNQNLVKVYTARHRRTNEILCVKRLYVGSTQEASDLQMEIISMSRLEHPNIIQVRSCLFDGPNQTIDSVIIIMDYYPEGDLESLLRDRRLRNAPWSDLELLEYARQLISPLLYMQEKNMCHRDLKAKNILVKDQGKVLKLSDLGSARLVTANDLNRSEFTIAGTPSFLSPKLRYAFNQSILTGVMLAEHNPFKSDVYSLGIVFLFMMSLNYSNELKTLNNLSQNLKRILDSFRNSYPKMVRLLSMMLELDEDQRADFKLLSETLNDLIVLQPSYCSRCRKATSDEELVAYQNSKMCRTCYESFMNFEVYCHVCNGVFRYRELLSANGDAACVSCLTSVVLFKDDSL
jgi:serine/threonine protein kinase